METQAPAQLCGTGRQLREDLLRQDDNITQLQKKMQEVQQEPDSLARRVPRSLHESLKSEMDRRALTRLQWTRHLESCWSCSAADSQAAA